MRSFLFSVLVILTGELFPPGVVPQITPASSLSLKGEVKRIREDLGAQGRSFDLELDLEFQNTGEKPIILLLGTYGKRQWWLLNTILTVEPIGDKTVVYVGGTSPANSASMRSWKQLRRQLDKHIPPYGLTYVLSPGKRFPHRVKTFVTISDADLKMIEGPLWLRVQLEMWPSNIETESSGVRLADYLSKKWAPTGILRVHSIVSEPIFVNLKAQPKSWRRANRRGHL